MVPTEMCWWVRNCALVCVIGHLAISPLACQAAEKNASKRVDRPKHGAVLLFEPASGKVLDYHSPHRLIFPASLAKLMTAYLAFEAIQEGKLTLTSTVEISDWARAQPPTRVGLKKGIEITLDFALRALIIRSANDLAIAIAEAVSGSEAAFIRRMNDTALRLGMVDTFFANPHGLPNQFQVSTARDLALLTSAVLRDFPQHQDIFSNPEVKIRKLTLRTHNSLLRTFEGADGMKTGFTCASGYNIIASATREGRRLVAVVVSAVSGSARAVRAAALLEYGFAKLNDEDAKPDLTLASLPGVMLHKEGTLDLSRKTRTWVCGNAPKPRKKRRRRKRRSKK